jgi:hypothetical protein
MNFTNLNIKDFIDYIITFDNINDILNKCTFNKNILNNNFVYIH